MGDGWEHALVLLWHPKHIGLLVLKGIELVLHHQLLHLSLLLQSLAIHTHQVGLAWHSYASSTLVAHHLVHLGQRGLKLSLLLGINLLVSNLNLG